MIQHTACTDAADKGGLWRWQHILSVCILFIGLSCCNTIFAVEDRTSAEAWIYSRLIEGNDANLREQFSRPSDRLISAAFLRSILTDKSLFNTGRTKPDSATGIIRIEHAIFTEPLLIEGLNIAHEIQLIDCQFEDRVSFSESKFLKDFSLARSTFRKDLELEGTEFRQQIDFSHIDVSRNMNAEGARFLGGVAGVYQDGAVKLAFANMRVAESVSFDDALFNRQADFEAISVGDSISFADAIFSGWTSFSNASIAGNFCARNATFEQSANFGRLYLQGVARFNGAKFDSAVSFINSEIGGMQAKEVFFGGNTSFRRLKSIEQINFATSTFMQDVDFERIQIGTSAEFDQTVFIGDAKFTGAEVSVILAPEAEFWGPASFDSISVQGMAVFTSVTFMDSVTFDGASIMYFGSQAAKFEGPVYFTNAKVRRRADIERAVFYDSAIFRGADISEFMALSTRFLGNRPVFLDRMLIRNDAIFYQTEFESPVLFNETEIAGNFTVQQSKFVGVGSYPSFEKIKVGERIDLSDTYIAGGIEMKGADIKFLDLDRLNSTEDKPLSINISDTIVSRDLSLSDARIGNLNASHLKVSGVSHVSNVVIEETANLEHSIFGVLNLCNVSFPESRGTKSLKPYGMEFQHISTGSGQDCLDAWHELEYLHKKTEYSAAAYANLETFFRQLGDPESANQVLIKQKLHEREEVATGLKLAWNWFVHYFVGDGTTPERALLWSILVVTLGTLVFWKESDMEIQNPLEDRNRPRQRYNPWWYSLDLFVPFIDLHSDNVWIPGKEHAFKLAYMLTHKILGWVLVPVSIAAFTGIIK